MTLSRVPILSIVLLLCLAVFQVVSGSCLVLLMERGGSPSSETDEKEANEKEVLVQSVARQLPRGIQRGGLYPLSRSVKVETGRRHADAVTLSTVPHLSMVLRC